MINYSKWKVKSVKVTKLRLDSRNPRFSHITKDITQNGLINEMIRNYKVYEIAKSITENGFFPDKNLICVLEYSHYRREK